MLSRIAQRTQRTLSRTTASAVASGSRACASDAGYTGGPTFELTEEQASIRELARQFTVRRTSLSLLCTMSASGS